MKNIKILFFLALSLFTSSIYANTITDSLSYEEQRAKVNRLLDDRVKKFGEYDTSLAQKTGIFGLFKTKTDMQKSINILQEIVKNDNKIFIETRQLLIIKDGQAEKYQQLANEYDTQVTAYMKTISKLQVENENLREKINTLEEGDNNNDNTLFIMSFILIGLLIVIFMLYRQLKREKLTKV